MTLAVLKEHSIHYILNKTSYVFIEMVVTDENGNNGAGIYCKLHSFMYLLDNTQLSLMMRQRQ
jgi:hypothetical protein